MQSTITLLVSAAVLAMLLVAVTLPWLVVNLRGQFSFSLIDAVRGLTSTEAVDASNYTKGDFASFTSTYKDIYLAFAFSMMFYASAIVYMVGSLVSANKRKAALGPAGTFAIAAAVAWIFGIETLKSHVLADAESGGPLAQLASGFINSVFSAGAGPYLVLAGGIIALAYYFMKEPLIDQIRHHRKHEERDDEEEGIEAQSHFQERVNQDYPQEENANRTTNVRLVVSKSSGTTALIAFIGAIFGLPGLGHIYIGRIGRGLLILISGFALYALTWLTLFGGFLGGIFSGARSGLPIFQTGATLAIILLVMYFGLLIWQIFNARSLAKKFNEQVLLTGKEPW
jgi:hypothetical protein